MFPIHLQPDQVEFALISFEGPDLYSKAGGLGVRVANLAEFLASQGFHTHLLFIGDPDLPGRQVLMDGKLVYHRWCQWISQYHPNGVYDGEEGKLLDFNRSAPPYIVEQIARPAIKSGRHLVILAEEWHTAQALIHTHDRLCEAGLRQYIVLLWNANNTKGFERVDWRRLDEVATLTTVSRYMKQIMRGYELDPLIIPNGIPVDLLQPPDDSDVEQVRSKLIGDGALLLFKVGRYDPDKCWWSAVEASAMLKEAGETVRFLCRGGIESHGNEVLTHARQLDLVVKDVDGCPETWQDALEAICAAGPAEIYNLRFSMSSAMLQVFYAAADFVLANSKHEPFGLVGLEAMAAGGVVFTGPTGETYSADGAGAIALDTESPDEVVLTIEGLRRNPESAEVIRQIAPYIAAGYTWGQVTRILFEKINLAASHQAIQPLDAAKSERTDLIQKKAVKPYIRLPQRQELPPLTIPMNPIPVEIPENASLPGAD
jgi:glycosyltransferase involved in cell wall biosynthesis